MTAFDLQGHRGARGLQPENTLPAFEVALDLMVSSLETDLHLTSDGVPVLSHDSVLSAAIARVRPGHNAPSPAQRPRISALTIDQLRGYLVDQNPDRVRFPNQSNQPTPMAKAFAQGRGLSAYGLPALDDFFHFVADYAGEPGKQAGKSDEQRMRARLVRFNLELKRTPFRPEHIGDSFTGEDASLFEQRVVEAVRKAGVAERTVVESFDHRCVRAVRRLEPKITGAILTANTAPASIPELARSADAAIYSPEFEFLDQKQVRQAQDAKLRVIPYTVNALDDMQRLLDWGVDGIITDFPDRLIPLLQARHMRF